MLYLIFKEHFALETMSYVKTDAIDLESYLVGRLQLVVYFLGFTIPFLISQPQLLTGIIVNTLLFVAASRLKPKALLPLLILPSLGAFSHGALFGPLTMFLIYFLPIIWLGNYALVKIFTAMESYPFLMRIFFSATIKSLLLYLIAQIYFSAHIVPQVFVTSMGMFQFITALLGGLVAYFIIKRIEVRR